MPSRRSKLSDWWSDYGPRWPAWDVTVYAWHQDKPDSDEEYEYLFTVYQMRYFASKSFAKFVPTAYAEHQLTAVREYSWR